MRPAARRAAVSRPMPREPPVTTGEVLINGEHGAPNVDLVRSFYKHSSLGGGMDLVPGYQLVKSILRG